MDEKLFTSKIGLLEDYYGKKLKRNVVDLYWQELKDIEDRDFQARLKKIIRTFSPTPSKPFPLISDFVEAEFGWRVQV